MKADYLETKPNGVADIEESKEGIFVFETSRELSASDIRRIIDYTGSINLTPIFGQSKSGLWLFCGSQARNTEGSLFTICITLHYRECGWDFWGMDSQGFEREIVYRSLEFRELFLPRGGR